ncbi:hypothetical protein HNQ02_002816 [Flavobacterium sp. 7E]|uniref:hypothetical protein n=1 Tax=Flavobacterium sp. 7E TaxID=2735898 RepID=UPI00156F11A7|nr:hypothetical protein [Flavobacterium sp. 7E]NRS89882.1 hypothetical protein [Flavobacterium sp. 7E]
MKTKIYLILITLFFINCKLNTNDEKNNIAEEKDSKNNLEKKINNYETPPVNFLEEKYQKNGFVLPDNSPSYPSYNSSDKNFIFSVNYIGKTQLEQYYWDIENTSGFFAQFEKINIATGNFKMISQKVKDVLKTKSNNYYVISSFLPNESILKYDSGDFELKEDAITFFYLYENNKWVFIKKIKTKKINEVGVSFYNNLILDYKLKKTNFISKEFQGEYSVFVETEFTTNGMANINYNFTVLKDKVLLQTKTYHEPISCNGEYKAIESDTVLDLYYVENKESFCKKINSSFSIKKEDEKYFIKGVGGEGTFNDWIEITKKQN